MSRLRLDLFRITRAIGSTRYVRQRGTRHAVPCVSVQTAQAQIELDLDGAPRSPVSMLAQTDVHQCAAIGPMDTLVLALADLVPERRRWACKILALAHQHVGAPVLHAALLLLLLLLLLLFGLIHPQPQLSWAAGLSDLI